MNIKSIEFKTYSLWKVSKFFFGYGLNIEGYYLFKEFTKDDLVKASTKDFKYHDVLIEKSNENFLAFCEKLINEIHILKWKANYSVDPDILDGVSWELIITFNDDSTFTSQGTNIFPYRFKKFEKLCNKYQLS